MDKINNVTHTTIFIYDKDNRPTETDLAGGGKVIQSYDISGDVIVIAVRGYESFK